jgi:DNA mismatch repair protein MutL
MAGGEQTRPAEAEGRLMFPRGRTGGSAPLPLDRLPAAPVSAPVPVSTPTTDRPGPDRPGQPEAAEPRYCGQLFKLFLLVEYGTSLYIVDQHAAHERILFEELTSARPISQELLMPIRLEMGQNAADILADRRELFDRLGVRVERSDDGTYEITALPEALISIEEQTLVDALLLEKGSVDELVERVFSLASCRLAVKEGRELDPLTAMELIRGAFRLSNARCPHGRPIWFEVTERQLLREVGRT